MLGTLLALSLFAVGLPGYTVTPGFVVVPGVLPSPPTPAPASPTVYQWITLTNEPGVEGWGYVNANGYAVGITHRRWKAGYAPAPVVLTPPAPVFIQQTAVPQYYAPAPACKGGKCPIR